MDATQLPVIAGLMSTSMFVLSNVGNLIHWVYIASLPFGPIWLLHGFFTITTALMLSGYLYFQCRQPRAASTALAAAV